MPKFDASSVGDVEYDFTGWKGIKGSVYAGVPIDDKGEIPEPSPEMVSQAMKRFSGAFKKVEAEDVAENAQAIADAMKKVNDEDTFKLMADELLNALAELCDGAPRKESLEALGWRRFMAFIGYVMGELMSPEVLKSDTNDTRGRLRSV